jgi:hypothetical protein
MASNDAEVPVVALLLDSRQAATDAGKEELKQLAITLPPTNRFLVCLLQSAYCGPAVIARDAKDRIAAIQKVFDRLGNADGYPHTDDVSRILNRSVNAAFQDSWNEASMVTKRDVDRQILVVLVSPTIYIELDSSGQSHLRNSSIPLVCIPDYVRPAVIDREARMKLVLVVTDEVYPVSGVEALSQIVSNGGKNTLEGVYQVKRACPSETDNVANWISTSSPDGTTSCSVQRNVRWRGGKAESLSCAPRHAGLSSPPPLLSILQSATANVPPPKANSGSPAAPAQAPPVQPGQSTAPGKTATKAPPGTPDPSVKPADRPGAPLTVPKDAGDKTPVAKNDAPKGGITPAPDPSHLPAPGTSTPRPQASPPPSPTPPIVVAPTPAPPPKPPRRGPDPATVMAAADANPPPAVTGALVRQQLVREVEGGPITIEFVRQADGLDLTLGLANSQNAIVASSGTGNSLAFNAPPHAGSFSILATPVARDPNCRSGRRVRGTVNLGARGVASMRIAVDLEVSRCGVGIKPIVIGTLTVK